MKAQYQIKTLQKDECKPILYKHHYLSNISKGFKSGVNYGLIYKAQVVGVCIFTGFPVPELVVGAFGLDRKHQDGFYELSRLCLTPEVQQKEHNIASWFVSRCIRLLKSKNNVRAILSYADNDYHKGTVYRALGFSYYGLTQPKKDFFIKQSDGSYKKHSRGKVKGLEGEWRYRSQKHRFLKVFDKNLNVKWENEQMLY